MGAEVVRYTASDGCEVVLDRETVTKCLLTGSSTCSDADLAVFMGTCRARGLNPLAREAYLVKHGSGPATTIVSKDYYVRAARAQPDFRGFKAGVIVMGQDGALERREGSFYDASSEWLLGGWAEVSVAGVEFPYRSEVRVEEYSTGQSTWAKMPATMVRKVALVQALREAYPGTFGGTYDAAEMGAAGECPPPAPAPGVSAGGECACEEACEYEEIYEFEEC